MQEDTCTAQKVAKVSPAGRPSLTRAQRSPQPNGEGARPASQRDSACRRGDLAKDYEARNSAVHKIWRQNLENAAPETPRPARKPGLRTFTNPTNPFERSSGIRVPSMDEMRQDADRAGARTKNPGILPAERSATNEERRTSPHFYSAPADWRRQKRCVAPPNGGRSSAGVMSILLGQDPDVAESTSSKQRPPAILQNYLNDMKKCSGAKRTGPSTPSAEYQRMMDRRVQLPAEREVAEMLPASARPFGADSDYGSPRASPRRLTRSVSCEPWLREPSNGGFQRRRQVLGSWTRSTSADVFHHNGEATVTPRRFERLERAASAQFDVAVEHMRSTLPAQRNLFNECRAQGKEGSVNTCLAPTTMTAE
mmetsp:Transcript_40849/g.94067  ORF Transcript_40849/g.94067 Transcript_40849/m.94067 type:complete len:367 (+) Transcript_40849:103-1203(+)